MSIHTMTFLTLDLRWLRPACAIFLAALALTSFPRSSTAEMYKCTDGGNVTFSDKPCGNDARKIEVKPSSGSNPGSYVQKSSSSSPMNNPYMPQADAVKISSGLRCDKQIDVKAMQKLSVAYASFTEMLELASSVPRAGIGSSLIELLKARDAVISVDAQSECAKAIKAAAVARANLSYSALKTFAAGDKIDHLLMESAAIHAGIHYNEGRKLYGF